MSVGLIVLTVCVVVALACVGLGVLRAAGDGLRLKKRIATYKRLPIFRLVAATQQRVADAERRLDGIPALLLRVNAASAELAAARDRVRAALVTAAGAIRFLPAFIIDNLPALFATKPRIRGN